jgi:hypothetical protein
MAHRSWRNCFKNFKNFKKTLRCCPNSVCLHDVCLRKVVWVRKVSKPRVGKGQMQTTDPLWKPVTTAGLLLALVSYFFGGDAGGFGVEVGGTDRFQVCVEGVLEWDAGWDVEGNHLFFG